MSTPNKDEPECIGGPNMKFFRDNSKGALKDK